ncbi:MAG: transglutaminase-like domain-containing protein [Cytophagales bacterium]|nr:transglutaminase-like domain-containing protein [Cytophagales bacterium]
MMNTLKKWVMLLGFAFLASCQSYPPAFEQALLRAGSNAKEFEQVWEKIPETQRKGFEFLVAHMPDRDLKELKSDLLLKNLKWAYRAREEFVWAKQLPDSVFFNEVLPYASFNERRDDWREDFYNKFSPLVKGCRTVEEAIDTVNHAIMNIVKVKYSTARKKADQSPYESMEQGLASCTGLSILLTDAFRSVGIPSRIAGTPNWTTKPGNHNWCEVLVDGQWLFTEYYAPKQLNDAWFLADAGKADPAKPKHWIYASSWKKQPYYYPLVWDTTITYVHAENVTKRYLDVYRRKMAGKALAEGKCILNIRMFKKAGCSMGDDRVAAKVSVYNGKKKLVAEGTTRGPLEDMNDLLSVPLEKGKSYRLVYSNAKGLPVSEQVVAKGQSKTVNLYME